MRLPGIHTEADTESDRETHNSGTVCTHTFAEQAAVDTRMRDAIADTVTVTAGESA